MNTFLTNVTIITGEHSKKSTFLVQANSFSLASDYAIYSESNDPGTLDWSENRVIDLGGEFAYHATVSKVKQCEVDVLKKHLVCVTARLGELLDSGNYKEHRYIEPCNVPQSMWETALAQATRLLIESGPSDSSYSNYLYIKNYGGDEIPHCVQMITNPIFCVETGKRNVLLERIDYLAKIIESTMMYAIKDNHHSHNTNVSNWINNNIGTDLIDTLNKGIKSDIWYDAHDHNDTDAANVIDEVQSAMGEIALTLENAITK